ncbi:ribosome biogenesis factor YjgA [Dokdonella koreensis]|uniref:Dual-action ribosomal maturation protein DarP n=1 Tax=Dokdonella koreensis DS-123 TaxID=1300342 RepID=A0A160DVE6_9GAMM|nr:ribosome biogenesis factor YjgA [Dokdonella koreensis]ANB17743.1 DUF615 domain containing protein [Dokdonella koreensis DS-123]
MIDHDVTDEYAGPSRSQLRREALDVLKLATALAALSDAQLDRLPLPEDVRGEVERTRATPSHGARKRQTQYLAKHLRRLDEEALEAIRRLLDHDRQSAHRETALLHQLEAWRDRLVAEGDPALDALLERHPGGDRQQLRALIRQARLEAERAKPPRAARELFRLLRAHLDAGPAA